jgi:hypothetical protein
VSVGRATRDPVRHTVVDRFWVEELLDQASEARDNGKEFGVENTMTVAITSKSTQHTGLALSAEGSVAAWQVMFQLDGDESLHAAISIPLTGPPTHHEAQQKALKILQVFLNDACEAAKKYQFSN